MNKIEELEQKIDKITEKFGLEISVCKTELEQIKKTSERIEKLKAEGKVYQKFIPNIGQRYWVVNAMGRVDWFIWQVSSTDEYLLVNTPLFRTEAEAERYLEFKQELAKRRWIVTKEEWENNNILKYYICEVKGEIYADYCNLHNRIGTIYFKTREDAQYMIDNYADILRMELI